MSVLVFIIVLVLALPVLLLVGIALGPAALVMLYLFGCVALVTSLERPILRRVRRSR